MCTIVHAMLNIYVCHHHLTCSLWAGLPGAAARRIPRTAAQPHHEGR